MVQLLEAIHFATIRHGNQLRKDGKSPYITHALAVALLISKITKDQDLVIAGILHDLIEDTDTSYTDICAKFGNKIADIVASCSIKNSGENWLERKQRALDNIKRMTFDAALVKAADILHNTYEMRVNVENFGIEYLEIFSIDAQTKISYERKRLEELKLYHGNIHLLKDIEENLKFLEASVVASSTTIIGA